ncbi:membrane protein YczE [Ursidibacter arcticus]
MSRKSPIPKMPWAADHQWQFKPYSLFVICIAMALMGIGDGLLVLANLGATPWTIFAQGVALQTGLSIGVVIAIVSLIVLLLWIPLKLRIGLGTLLNVFIIALFIDLTVNYIPAPSGTMARIFLMIFAIVLFGISTTFYLSCQLGAGPRDGLMVGVCLKYGWKVGIVRTTIEATVGILGLLLGGTLGISTIAFALGVGWIIQFTAMAFQRFGNQTSGKI